MRVSVAHNGHAWQDIKLGFLSHLFLPGLGWISLLGRAAEREREKAQGGRRMARARSLLSTPTAFTPTISFFYGSEGAEGGKEKYSREEISVKSSDSRRMETYII